MNNKFTSSKNMYAGIHGSSTVNHRIRAMLGLTIDEYVVMQYFYKHITLNKQTTKIECIKENCWKDLGMRIDELQKIYFNLRDKEMLCKSIDNGAEVFFFSDKWLHHFQTDLEFEEFWKIYHVGNKQDAKMNYQKARKEISKELLLKKAIEYLNPLTALTDDWKPSPMHTCRWLNPTKKHWEDAPFISTNTTKQNQNSEEYDGSFYKKK